MKKKFNILTRKECSKKLSSDPYYKAFPELTKNLNLPLRGFCSHEGHIPCGTVIGIIIQSSESLSIPYTVSSDVVKSGTCFGGENSKNAVKCEQKTFRYRPIYEFFFRIVKVHNGNSYSIQPVYLDSTKQVLRKPCSHDFDSIAEAKLSLISDKSFIINQFVTQSNYSIDLEDYISTLKISNFLKLMQEEPFNIEKIKKNIPFDNYKNIIDPYSEAGGPSSWLSNIDIPLYRFYQCFELNKARLSNILTEDEMERIGSWDLVVSNSNKVYKEALDFLGDYVSIPIKYSAEVSEGFTDSLIDISDLKSISKSLIFRVLLPDLEIAMIPSESLTTWSFAPLSKAILGFLQAGNIVRCLLTNVDDLRSYSKHYVNILYKINPQKYLVSYRDAYSNIEEDCLFILDIDAILEIPLTWPGNENLELAAGSLTPPTESSEEDPTSLHYQLSVSVPIGCPESVDNISPIKISYTGIFGIRD